MGNTKARFSFWDLQRFEERWNSKKSVPIVDDKKRIRDLIEEVKSKKDIVSAGNTVKNNKRKRGLTELVLLNNTTRGNSIASDATRASSRASRPSGGM